MVRKSWIQRVISSLGPKASATSVNLHAIKVRPVLGSGLCRSYSENYSILGTRVPAGTKTTITWTCPVGEHQPIKVIVVNGKNKGPVLGIIAAVHGDELNGIEIAREITRGLVAEKLHGAVVCIPIVNFEGYQRRQRLMDECDDLNRLFPGDSEGSYSSRVAHFILHDIIRKCDAIIDVHTGSAFIDNLPQLRADLSIQNIADFSTGVGSFAVVQCKAPEGSLRAAATNADIPAIVMEVGGAQGLEKHKIDGSVIAIRKLMHAIGMDSAEITPSENQQIFYGNGWVKAEADGIFVGNAELGLAIKEGAIIGEIINPDNDTVLTVTAPFNSTVLGRAHNRYVSAGTCLYRIGILS